MLRRLALALTCALVFVGSLGVAPAIHVGAPTLQRVLIGALQSALNQSLIGSVELGRLERLGADDYRVSSFRLLAPDGDEVLYLEDVRVETQLASWARELLLSRRRIRLLVPHARVERARVLLATQDGSTRTTLEESLTLRPSTDDPDTRDLHLWLPSVELGRADASVRLETLPESTASVQHVSGAVRIDPGNVRVDVAQFGATLRTSTGLEGRGTGSLSLNVPGHFEGQLNGVAEGVEFLGHVKREREEVNAQLRLPRVPGRLLHHHFPLWPEGADVSADVEVVGELPTLTVSAKASARDAELVVKGEVHTTTPAEATAEVTLRHFDLHAVDASWPETDVNVVSTVTYGSSPPSVGGKGNPGKPTLRVEGHSQQTHVAENAVPRVEFDLSADADGLLGDVRILEEGLPLGVHVNAKTTDGVHLEWTAGNVSLANWKRFDHGVRAQVNASGKLTLRSGKLDANARADVRSFHYARATVASASLRVTAAGPVATPDEWVLDAETGLSGAALWGFELRQAHATFDGTIARGLLQIDATDGGNRSARLRGTASLTQRSLSGATLSLEAKPLRAEGRIRRFELDTGHLGVDELSVEGPKTKMSGRFAYQPQVVELVVQGDSVDLAEISRAAGLGASASGRGSLRVDVSLGREMSRGSLGGTLHDFQVGPVPMDEADFHVDLRDGKVSGSLVGKGDLVGEVLADVNGTVPSADDGKLAWERTTGSVRLRAARIPLAAYGVATGATLGVSMDGHASVQLRLERQRDDQLPVVFFDVGTDDLVLHGKNVFDGSPSHDGPLTIAASGALDPNQDQTHGALRLYAAGTELITGSGTVETPWRRFLAEPQLFREIVASLALAGTLRIPDRSLDELPALLRPPDVTGALDLRASVGGTVADPSLFVMAGGRQLRWANETEPFDVQIHGGYAAAQGEVNLTATASVRGARAAAAQVQGKYQDTDVGRRWVGAGSARFSGLPLGVVSALAGAHLDGRLFGTVRLANTARRTSINGRLEVPRLAVRAADLGKATFEFDANQRDLSGRLSIGANVLVADMEAHSATSFPTVDELDVRVRARALDAAVAGPLLDDVARDLAGGIDADAELVVSRNARGQPQLAVSGKGTLTKGSMYLVPLGARVQGVGFGLSATKTRSRSVVRVSRITAKAGQSGTIRGQLALILDDLVLSRGTGKLQVHQLPLLIDGVSRGQATGALAVDLARKQDHTLLALRAPTLRIELPPSTTRTLIDVDTHPDVHVVQEKPDPAPLADSFPWRVAIDLSGDVVVTGLGVRLPIDGQPEVHFADRVSTHGRVVLEPGGRVPVLGKVFTVERGYIELNPKDTGNPHVNVVVSWQAPDGTRVYVAYEGSVEGNERPRFSSVPSLPEDDVLALILGGSADPAGGGSAVALGSGVAAEGLSQLLGSSLSDVQVRVDADEQDNSNYAAAVRIGEDLWFEGSYRRRRASEPSQTENIVTGTVDYRINRRWSVRTELGLGGGALDLRWQYTY